MRKILTSIVITAATMTAVSCASHYEVANISRSRILVDNRYDRNKDAEAEKFIAPFKAKVDSIMSPVVGQTARYLDNTSLRALYPTSWQTSSCGEQSLSTRNRTLLYITLAAYVPLLPKVM